MPSASTDPRDIWNRLRPDAVQGLKDLLALLETDGDSQDVFDVYLYCKRVLAEAMEARIGIELNERCETFHELRSQLEAKLREKYGDQLPAAYLTIPYGSLRHEKLFLTLLQRKGADVPASLLRIVTGDSVHTERRVRELRELGLDIDTGNTNSVDTYRLSSLDLDISFMPTIVFNNARDKKHRYMKKADLQEILQLD